MGLNKTYDLELTSEGYHISKNCRNCHAIKILQNREKKAFELALLSQPKKSISPSARLCLGLKGLVWLLQDSNKKEVSICEFDDHSFLLMDNLATQARKIGVIL